MYGCGVDWSAQEGHATRAETCSPFEVSCLFPGDARCDGVGTTSLFVILLAVGDPWGTAVWGHKRILLRCTRGCISVCPHKEETRGGGGDEISFPNQQGPGVGIQSVSRALRTGVPTHRSSCGCVWLVYRHHCCPSPQESCTWVLSLCCRKSERTRCNEPHLFWQNHHLCDWTDLDKRFSEFGPTGLLLTQRKAGTQWSWPSRFPASGRRSQESCPTLLGFGTLRSLWSPWNLPSSQDLEEMWWEPIGRVFLWLCSVCSCAPPPPVSDAFCWESSSSSDSDPRSLSLPPFSMLLLELPTEVWETPNLEVGDKGQKMKRRRAVHKSESWRRQHRSQRTSPELLPRSGFSLCCIVHLLLLPNVLLFFSIVKRAYPLFTAGFKSSRVGLCAQTHLDDPFLSCSLTFPTKIPNISNSFCRGFLIKHLHYYHQHLDWSLFRQFCRMWHWGKRMRQMCNRRRFKQFNLEMPLRSVRLSLLTWCFHRAHWTPHHWTQTDPQSWQSSVGSDSRRRPGG